MSIVWRVLVTDALGAEGLSALGEVASIELDVQTELDRAQLLARVAGQHALVVRSQTRVDAELIGAAAELRFVVRAGTGVDNVDVRAATKRGVVVMNTPGANSNAAAEHTICLMLALSRQLVPAARHVKAGGFDKRGLMGVELSGKTLGVVGLGRIGLLVAKLGGALGMDIVAHDPLVDAAAVEHPLVTLEELLEQCDYLSLHMPLVDATHHLIDGEALARMKPTAFVVNCARGGLIDEQALLQALERGGLAGAALDVFEAEPEVPAQLVARDDVIATPHLGAQTREARAGVGKLAADVLASALRGKPINVVNPEVLP